MAEAGVEAESQPGSKILPTYPPLSRKAQTLVPPPSLSTSSPPSSSAILPIVAAAVHPRPSPWLHRPLRLQVWLTTWTTGSLLLVREGSSRSFQAVTTCIPLWGLLWWDSDVFERSMGFINISLSQKMMALVLLIDSLKIITCLH